MATKIIEMNRDAKTGRLVTEKYAKAHPDTTEHERRKVIVPPPAPTKKK